MTPSLATLDDATALKQKAWSRGEPGEDTFWMFTTIGGHLTLTAPVYGDMRTDVMLNVTPEEPLNDLPAAVGGIEERNMTQQTHGDARGPTPNVVPPSTEVPETSPKVINVRSDQESPSRRNTITRETSREDALAATRFFFNTVNERRNIPEVLVMSTTGVSQIDTFLVPPDPIETEPAEPGTDLLEFIYQMDHHLDLLLQLLVDLRHGFNAYQRDKLKNILGRMRTQ